MAREPRTTTVDSQGATLLRTAQGQTLLRGIGQEPTVDANQVLGTSPRYRLDRRLGGGAFGAVYQATTLDAGDTVSPERVAIKVLHGELPDAQRAHVLKRELSSLRAISCPRIPTVFYADVGSDPPYLVMELFPHGTLEDMVSHHGPLNQVNALSLLVSLLEAAHAAHHADVLHLDIKPANVLLDGAGGFVLTDFGISQAPRIALALQGLGSSGWHAPEQQPGHSNELDPRTDLFGVGATVWSAMTGIDLASPVGQLSLQRAAQSPVALPLIRSVIDGDPELESVVMSLLARSPSDRPGSALDVLAQLQGKVPAAQRLPGRPVTIDAAHDIIEGIVDPLVARMFEADHRGVRRVLDGEILCHQDEVSSYAYLLLAGRLTVVRDGERVATVGREGEIVGEVSAFTGAARNATLVADGDVWVHAMNASQLENLVTANPALAVRLIRTMAKRFLQG